MYRKHPSPLLNDRLAERLPGLSMDQIVQHVEWFIEFEQRQCTKRKLFTEWRERMAELDQEAAEAQELWNDKETRRKIGLKRSRIAEQRRQVIEWRQTQQQKEEEAAAAQRSLMQEKAQRKKEEARKQAQDKVDQKRALDKYRQERAAARVAETAERQAARPESVGVSPDVRRRIRGRNSALLKKLQEDAQVLRRARSEPTVKTPKNHAYDHVESNVYASTVAFSQRVAALRGMDTTSTAAPNQPEWGVYNAWLDEFLSKEQAATEVGNQGKFTIPEEEPPSTFEAVD